MRIFDLPAEKNSRFLLITLLSITGALILILVTGTIVGLARPRHAQPLIVFGGAARPQQTALQTDDIRVFSGMGRMRIPLADSSVLILSVAFPYSANDIAFTEELAAKIGDLREISTNYFHSLPAERLIPIDEDAAKREILSRFNAGLRLGHITALYFSDMMVIPPLSF